MSTRTEPAAMTVDDALRLLTEMKRGGAGDDIWQREARGILQRLQEDAREAGRASAIQFALARKRTDTTKENQDFAVGDQVTDEEGTVLVCTAVISGEGWYERAAAVTDLPSSTGTDTTEEQA